MKLHHTALCVDEIQPAIEWYKNRLSFDVDYQDETWALLSFDNTKIALVLPSQHPPHVAFEHDKASTFGEMKPHRDGTASVYVQDPFGNTIELLQPASND